MSPESQARSDRTFRWTLAASLLLALALAGAAAGLHLRRAGALGRLEVASLPPGCAVRLDGRYAGLTPLRLEGLAPGEHLVVVGREGYLAETVRVKVGAGANAAVRLTLAAKTLGRLAVRSDPPGATAVLDGENRGTTPLEIEDLAPGTHRLVLRRARREPWSGTVRVQGGKTTAVSAEMEDSFRKFLAGAVTAEPRNMAHRGELFHYLMAEKEWKGAAEAFFDATEMMAVKGLADASKGGMWHWFSRDAHMLVGPAREKFTAVFAGRLAALASEDADGAAKVVRLFGSLARRSGRRMRNPTLLRELCFAAALEAAAHRPVVVAAIDFAAEVRSGSPVGKLLEAAARARPGDGEHIGQLAARVLSVIKSRGIGGSFRGESLEAAAAAVAGALAAGQKDKAVAARLRRMLARIRAAQDRKEAALAQMRKAVAELAALGEKEARRLATWRLELAEVLAGAGKTAEARRLLAGLAAGAADPEVRQKAAAKLKELGPGE